MELGWWTVAREGEVDSREEEFQKSGLHLNFWPFSPEILKFQSHVSPGSEFGVGAGEFLDACFVQTPFWRLGI